MESTQDQRADRVSIDDVDTTRWWMLAATGGAIALIALAIRRLQ
ncbi:hypothetical protein [Rhodococcus sp. ACT016]